MNKIKIKSAVRKYGLVFILLFFFGFLSFNLLNSRMLETKADGLYSGGSTWGDLAFHLSIISGNLARGADSLKEFPVYTGEKFSYPPASDIASAFLIKAGISLQNALIYPTLIMVLFSVFLIYTLSREITKNKFAGFLAPFIFFFNGSLAGLYYFWIDWKDSHLELLTFLNKMEKEYAHLADYNIRFSNIIADYVLPQRTFVAGLALGMIAVLFLWRYWENKNHKELLKAGIATAFLPLVHTHSFLAIVIIAGFLVIIQFWEDRKNILKIIKDWLYFAVPVLIFALPAMLWLYPFGKEHFMRWQIGWMAVNGNENIFLFWLKNLPAQLPIFFFAYFTASPKARKFYLAFVGLFIIANFIVFQPHDYDNMKLMIWWYIASSVLAAGLFIRIGQKYRTLGIFIASVLFISVTLVGGLSVYRESYTSWRMFSSEDIALADFVKSNTETEAVFLTPDNHINPIPCLSGRRIVMGYRGWLWTHGIDYSKREADVFSMYKGSDTAQNLLRQYDVGYVLVDQNQINDFHINKSFFQNNFTLIYESPTYILYKI